MFANSMIDASMIQAYAETYYRVFGDEPFTLRVGEASARLAVEHHRRDVTSSTYVTACNPFSRMLSADVIGVNYLGRQATTILAGGGGVVCCQAD